MSRFLCSCCAVAVLLSAPRIAFAHGGFELRINCGGPGYTDSADNSWTADQLFSGNGTDLSTTDAIAGTSDEAIYQTARRGAPVFYDIPLTNGDYQIVLHFAEFDVAQIGDRIFNVKAENQTMLSDVDIIELAGGSHIAATLSFNVVVNDGLLNLAFQGIVERPLIAGLEVLDTSEGDPFLHVVIEGETAATDYDLDGFATLSLDGQSSHTHEIGHDLTNFTWTMGATVVGSGETLDIELPLGLHTVTLTIEDDNVPPRELSDSINVNVYGKNWVGGVMTTYTVRAPDVGAPQQGVMRESMEIRQGFSIEADGNNIGNTALTSNVRATMEGFLSVKRYESYEFSTQGGTHSRIWVDGSLAIGPIMMYPGFHAIKAEFLIRDVSDLPAQVLMSVEGAPASSIPDFLVHHDQTDLLPFMNPFNNVGSSFGGNTVVLEGVGFFPEDQVTVNWGATTLVPPAINVEHDEITFVSPPGTGTIPVSVEAANGVSNFRTFTYNEDQAPIIFTTEVIATQTEGTQGEFGPDGRFYAASLDGNIWVYTFDDDYNVTAAEQITTIAGLANNNILGIGFNPFDAPSPVRLYVAHSLLFAQGGDCFEGSSDYNGQVSVLEGPDFDTVTPLITGLPVSNHDHSINAIQFDHEGNLLLAVGSQTNAGIAACPSGGLPESPLTAAVIRASIYKSGFNGAIQYREILGGAVNNDQVFGLEVELDSGIDVEPLITGIRNSFDLCFATNGYLYGSDNGPNDGFGAASTSATSQGPDPWEADEINLLMEGHYYGHPNRNRGLVDTRENVYRAPTDSPILGAYTAPISTENASINGLSQYRAMTFGGAMYNNLIYQKWNAKFYRGELAEDGRSFNLSESIANGPEGLDVVHGPGGVVLGIDYSDDDITLTRPNDAAAVGLTAYDIFPWRALPDGTVPFVIGGANFGSLADMKVTIGGQQAVLTSVTASRINGFIPASGTPTSALLDVVVENTALVDSATIPAAFRYVLPTATGKGSWDTFPPSPIALGEIAGGVVNGILYLVGESNDATLSFNPATETWSSAHAVRPHPGDHHAAEVIGGKLYLFGGLGSNSAGTVQIYDPVADSWSLGAEMPFDSGSANSAVIGGLAYVCGGIELGSTVEDHAVYDPALDSWTTLAPMPVGRNHAAAGTDGEKLYVFGGRGFGSGDGNVVAEGFDDVMIYDPGTDTWESSFDVGSTIPVLPQRRGGMGKAVFYHGEFYAIGGETTPTGQGAEPGDVYDRVDVYDPVSQSWRLETALPTPRHGIFPVVHDGKIYVFTGGTQAGNSQSTVFEWFTR